MPKQNRYSVGRLEIEEVSFMMALNSKLAPLLSSQPGGPPKTHNASQARYNLTRIVDSKYHGVQTCGVPGGQGQIYEKNLDSVLPGRSPVMPGSDRASHIRQPVRKTSCTRRACLRRERRDSHLLDDQTESPKRDAVLGYPFSG